MSTLTDRYTAEWCAQHPDRAAALIAHYEEQWANCSRTCARLQGERDRYKRQLETDHGPNS